jgi:hypothetical protein
MILAEAGGDESVDVLIVEAPALFGQRPCQSRQCGEFAVLRQTPLDAPFAATWELVAGFWLWEVKDTDGAVAWVKRCPNPMPGPSEIEIRPLYEMADLR